MKRGVLLSTLVICMACCILGLAAMNQADSIVVPADTIFVCQDEKAIEKAIAEYIERTHDVKATFSVMQSDSEDLYISYMLEPDNAPKVKLSIDTQVSNRNADKTRVTERAIRFIAFYVLPDAAKTPEARAKLLELNNTIMRENWFPGRIYIDKDGDVALETYINIPGPEIPMHLETCYDAVARTFDAWKSYYPKLKATVPVGSSD